MACLWFATNAGVIEKRSVRISPEPEFPPIVQVAVRAPVRPGACGPIFRRSARNTIDRPYRPSTRGEAEFGNNGPEIARAAGESLRLSPRFD